MGKKRKNFSLCVFGNYQVDYSFDYSYLDEDGDFADGKAKQSSKFDGGLLITKIIELLSDKDFISIAISGQDIVIESFNPHDGTGADYILKIKEL